MATYSLTTNTAKQDAALTYCAAKAGQTIEEYVQAQFARLVQRAINEKDHDDAQAVSTAYLAATNAKQTQVKNALGLS